MRILGIDPGTVTMGYGVVDDDGGEPALVTCGALRAPARQPIERRLLRLYRDLEALLAQVAPDVVAVEEPFVVHAPRKSALAVGEGRAIVLLAAAARGLPVAQYPPARVRATVADYGGGDKEQVREMIGLLLGCSLADHPLDTSDALAVALCHQRHAAFDGLAGPERPAPARRGGPRR